MTTTDITRKLAAKVLETVDAGLVSGLGTLTPGCAAAGSLNLGYLNVANQECWAAFDRSRSLGQDRFGRSLAVFLALRPIVTRHRPTPDECPHLSTDTIVTCGQDSRLNLSHWLRVLHARYIRDLNPSPVKVTL